MRTYTDRDDGSAIAIAVGGGFELRLPETPTTGFRWHLIDWDRAILEVARDELTTPDPQRHGAGGEHVWQFVARAPGHSPLRLALRRAWETGAPAKAFSADVSVA